MKSSKIKTSYYDLSLDILPITAKINCPYFFASLNNLQFFNLPEKQCYLTNYSNAGFNYQHYHSFVERDQTTEKNI